MRSDNDCPATQVLDAVRWAGQLGAVTAHALAVRDAISVETAARRLVSAQRLGLVRVTEPLRDQPALYSATAAGLRRVGEARLAPCRVRPGNAEHLVACAAVAAALTRRHPDHRVEGERQLRRDEHDAGQALVSARIGTDPSGEPRLHRPDLVLWPSGEEAPVAVEVELTVKAPRRLIQLCTAWARCHLVAGVLYCAAPAVMRPLTRAVTKTRAQDRIVVVELTGVLDPTPRWPGLS